MIGSYFSIIRGKQISTQRKNYKLSWLLESVSILLETGGVRHCISLNNITMLGHDTFP